MSKKDPGIGTEPGVAEVPKVAFLPPDHATCFNTFKIQGPIPPSGAHKKRIQVKSRRGCITCKTRKKKCDDVRPICGDCLRFSKQCVWIDEHMTREDIQALRQHVLEQETRTKMRKRRKKASYEAENGIIVMSGPENETKEDGNEVETNLEIVEANGNAGSNGAGNGVSAVKNIKGAPSPESTNVQATNVDVKPQPNLPPKTVGLPTVRLPKTAMGPSPEYIEALKANYGVPSDTQFLDQTGLIYSMGLNHGAQLGLHASTNTNYNKENGEYQNAVDRAAPLPQHNGSMSFRDRPGLPGFFSGISGHFLSPLDLEFLRENDSNFPVSPAVALNFLQELNMFHNNASSSKITMVDPENDDKDAKADDTVVASDPLDFKLSPNFSIPEFMNFILNHGSPQQLNHLATSFNTAFASSPQPSLSVLHGLDSSGNYLYNYYVDTLSKKVSIAPHSQDESNSYQKVFLPLAQRDKGVLYGILAWAGFHLGGTWLSEGSKYAEMAVKHLRQDMDFNNKSTLKQDRKAILNKLAALLILCGAEICRGDIKYWTIYLNWSWKLLLENGGILNFDTNKEEHFLVSNFAYHDLLASSTSQRGTYFPIDTYHRIVTDSDGVSRGNLNPLLGVCKSLFQVIGEISSFAYDSKKTLEIYYDRASPKDVGMSPTTHVFHSPETQQPYFLTEFDDLESETSEHGRHSRLLLSIIEKAKNLERSVDTARPDSQDLVDLNDSELELQLTTFEAFQLSCKLYLRQSIMKCNPSSLESQVLVNDLVKCLDILIDSPMQASLVFPMFIAGVHMVTEDDKVVMSQRIDKMMDMYGPWNLIRVKHLIELVWERNPDGDRVVDWHSILVELGWELNFA